MVQNRRQYANTKLVHCSSTLSGSMGLQPIWCLGLDVSYISNTDFAQFYGFSFLFLPRKRECAFVLLSKTEMHLNCSFLLSLCQGVEFNETLIQRYLNENKTYI